MGRGTTQNAEGGFGSTQKMGETANVRGQNIYNELFPQLSSEATNPQGYGQIGLNAMNTANQESIGGSNASAAGEGNLAAARTRNAGGFQPAVSESNRAGARQLSTNALGIQAGNENMRQKQQQAALGALQGLYGTQMNTALGAQNAGIGYLNAATNASNQTSNTGLGIAKLGINAVTGA